MTAEADVEETGQDTAVPDTADTGADTDAETGPSQPEPQVCTHTSHGAAHVSQEPGKVSWKAWGQDHVSDPWERDTPEESAAFWGLGAENVTAATAHFASESPAVAMEISTVAMETSDIHTELSSGSQGTASLKSSKIPGDTVSEVAEIAAAFNTSVKASGTHCVSVAAKLTTAKPEERTERSQMTDVAHDRVDDKPLCYAAAKMCDDDGDVNDEVMCYHGDEVIQDSFVGVRKPKLLAERRTARFIPQGQLQLTLEEVRELVMVAKHTQLLPK